jgi:hypothetical protein
MAARKRKRKWNVQVGDATLDQGEAVPMGDTVPYGTMPAAHNVPWEVLVGAAQIDPGVSVEIGEPEFFRDGVRAVLGEPVITSEAPAPKRKPKKPVRK